MLHGATGVGKTGVAIAVAKALGCPIVNADSRQVYKEMTIGTAVPSKEELAQVEHFFIQTHSVAEPLSAGQYANEVLALLDELFEKHDNIILTGGSGMYINAVLYGMDELPSDDVVRAELAQKTIGELDEMLLQVDVVFYNQIDHSNRNRMIRAVEVCLVTGKPYSEQRTGEVQKRNFDFIQIALDRPREELYERINKRVEVMIEAGLEDEARSVERFREVSSLNTVGYREFFDYFDGKITHDEAVELIKRNSRRYAKRQYTWMRSIEGLHWVAAEDVDQILRLIDEGN